MFIFSLCDVLFLSLFREVNPLESCYFYHQLFDSPQKQIKVKFKIADNFQIYSLKYYFVTYFL